MALGPGSVTCAGLLLAPPREARVSLNCSAPKLSLSCAHQHRSVPEGEGLVPTPEVLGAGGDAARPLADSAVGGEASPATGAAAGSPGVDGDWGGGGAPNAELSQAALNEHRAALALGDLAAESGPPDALWFVKRFLEDEDQPEAQAEEAPPGCGCGRESAVEELGKVLARHSSLTCPPLFSTLRCSVTVMPAAKGGLLPSIWRPAQVGVPPSIQVSRLVRPRQTPWPRQFSLATHSCPSASPQENSNNPRPRGRRLLLSPRTSPGRAVAPGAAARMRR